MDLENRTEEDNQRIQEAAQAAGEREAAKLAADAVAAAALKQAAGATEPEEENAAEDAAKETAAAAAEEAPAAKEEEAAATAAAAEGEATEQEAAEANEPPVENAAEDAMQEPAAAAEEESATAPTENAAEANEPPVEDAAEDAEAVEDAADEDAADDLPAEETEPAAASKKCNLDEKNEDPEQTPNGTIMHKVRNYDAPTDAAAQEVAGNKLQHSVDDLVRSKECWKRDKDVAGQEKEPKCIDDAEHTPGGTIQVSTYDALLQDIADSPKSVYMGGGRTPAYIGRQKYKADQQKVKQQAANRKKSAKVYDKISAALTSPDSKLLTKNQLKELTMLFAQTSRPSGSEVSGLNPKVLSDQFQKVQSKKELADSDSDSSAHEGAKRPFNARDAALWSQLAATVSLTQVENDWLISDLVNQQVLASTPVPYTEQLHDALNGGGVRSMSDSEHDMVWVTFTNESFTHWAVSCSLQYRSSETLMLNEEDSMLWFDDLEDGGELKRLNQASFFEKLSGKWKFYSAEVLWHHRLTPNWKS